MSVHWRTADPPAPDKERKVSTPSTILLEKTATRRGTICSVMLATYSENRDRIAMQLTNKATGEPQSIPSVNLPNVRLQSPDNVLIRDSEENEGILMELIEAEIIKPQIAASHTSGFIEVFECQFCDDIELPERKKKTPDPREPGPTDAVEPKVIKSTDTRKMANRMKIEADSIICQYLYKQKRLVASRHAAIIGGKESTAMVQCLDGLPLVAVIITENADEFIDMELTNGHKVGSFMFNQPEIVDMAYNWEKI